MSENPDSLVYFDKADLVLRGVDAEEGIEPSGAAIIQRPAFESSTCTSVQR
ncbi:hypothetical protein [Pedobacter sp. NJ-S-72]